MGKMRNRRFRTHNKAAKDSDMPEEPKLDRRGADVISLSNRSAATTSGKKPIDIDAVIRDLMSEMEMQSRMGGDSEKEPDFDTRSVITSKSIREVAAEGHLKKQDKHKIRHAVRYAQLKFIYAQRKAELEKQKRQKTVIVGDMKPLEEALPSLDDWLSKSKKSSAPEFRKPRSIEKEKVRKLQMKHDLETLLAASNVSINQSFSFGM